MTLAELQNLGWQIGISIEETVEFHGGFPVLTLELYVANDGELLETAESYADAVNLLNRFAGSDEADDSDDYIDESMDGDHDSAMASAGWGTDEDYGYYGE